MIFNPYYHELVRYATKDLGLYKLDNLDMHRFILEWCNNGFMIPDVLQDTKPKYILFRYGLGRLKIAVLDAVYEEFSQFEYSDWLVSKRHLQAFKDYLLIFKRDE